MPTTVDYINQLKIDKENLVNNLIEKGIEAENSETFTSLVPKVLNIQGGSTTDLKITDCSYLFYGGARIECMNEILALCKDIINTSSMFYLCLNLTEVPKLDTSKVREMSYMFYNCQKLTEVPELDTGTARKMDYMFSSCPKLTKIPELDASSCDNISYVFNSDTALTDFGGFKNLGKNFTSRTTNYRNYKLDLSYCPNLTHESLMNVINNLYDLNLTHNVANGGTLYTQSLVLGATNLAKLTSEEIAIATQKGWTVS